MIASSQIVFMGWDWNFARRLHGLRNVISNLLRDFTGDFPFQREQIAHIAIKAFRPQVLVCPGANQLRTDSHPVAGPLYRTLHESIYAKVASDLGRPLE